MSTKEITIGGAIVTVTTPYAEGHTMNEAEAKSLNQTRAENIANNCRKFVSEKNEGTAKSPIFSEGDLTAIADHIEAYDAKYVFTLASVGGGRTPIDPLERECLLVVKEHIKGKIKEAGGLLKDYDKDALEAKYASLIDEPQVIKVAKARIKQREGLAELELDALTVAA